MKTKIIPLAIIFVFGLATIACSIPISVATAQPDNNQVAIQVAQTVAAINAKNAQLQVQPTLAPAPTLAPLSTTAPLPTAIPLSVSTAVPCVWATAVDVNYPDHSTVTHSTSFDKTWSFTNVGSCSWNSGYYVAFMSGTSMGGVTTHLANVVPPNGYINVTLHLTAPATAGTYRGEYGLFTNNGLYVGQVWVEINVV
jgi:hypothetical protein